MARPKLNNPTQGVTIRLAVVTVAKLKALAARQGIKFNTIMREVLEAHADEHYDNKK